MIAKALNDPLSEFYVAFCAFAWNEFEEFLVPLQSDEPKIHLLHPGICKLVSKIMSKFLKKNILTDDFAANVSLCEANKENQKPLFLIDVGTKCKLLLSDPFLFKHNQKLRKECLDFFLTQTTYLKKVFPFDKPVIKQAQYLHPEKRNCSAALTFVSNLTNSVKSV